MNSVLYKFYTNTPICKLCHNSKIYYDSLLWQIGFPSQLLLDNTEGHQDGTVLLSSTNQSQISNQNMVEMGKKLLEAASENNIDAVRSLMSGGAPFTGNWVSSILHSLFSCPIKFTFDIVRDYSFTCCCKSRSCWNSGAFIKSRNFSRC